LYQNTPPINVALLNISVNVNS